MKSAPVLHPAGRRTPSLGAAQGIVFAVPVSLAMWAAILLGVYLLA